MAISSPTLSGLKIDFYESASTLLGRCADFGGHFNLERDDAIEEIVIGITTTRYKRLQGIWFITAKGLCRGFVGDSLSKRPDQKVSNVALTSRSGMILRDRLAWSFDLGQNSSGDTGIEPIYSQKVELGRSEMLRTLYPTLDWTQAPASYTQLRPTPSPTTSRYPFVSSQLLSDDDDIYRDTKILSIRIYFNAFLQGVSNSSFARASNAHQGILSAHKRPLSSPRSVSSLLKSSSMYRRCLSQGIKRYSFRQQNQGE